MGGSLTDKQYVLMEKMICAFIILFCLFLSIILISAPIATEYNNILKMGNAKYQSLEVGFGNKRNILNVTEKDYNIARGFALGAGSGIILLFVICGFAYRIATIDQ